jgi:D-amino peptidase
MRIYISADMEGVNGVVLKEHVDPAAKEYAQAREWMIQEVNAAIEGAVQAGARQVVVNDSHNVMTNLPLDRLHPSASLVTGTQKPFSMVEDLDGTFNAAFFLGYHAKFGTPYGVLDHIFSYSIISKVRINEIAVGEFGLNAGMAGYFAVPSVLVTGDQAVVQEAKAIVPDIEAVVVKEGKSRYAAHCYPIKESLENIHMMAKRAVELASRKQVFKFTPPLKLEVVFQKVELADMAALLPHSRRTDEFTIFYETDEYVDLYRAFLAMLRLSRF